MNSDTKRGVARWIFKSIVYTVLFGLALFVPSGDLGWGWGWGYLAIYVINQIILTAILPRDLLAERSKPQEGSKGWDIVLASVAALLAPLVVYLVAGFDRGRGWSETFPPALSIVGLGVMVGGIALSDWAMVANKFFSGVIRIQADRGHTVETGGPYRFVRHPGYVGGILHHLGAPLMLGSWWALIPGGIGALLFVLRTALEDKTLQQELPGYAEYAQRTRYRLLPGVW
ncbi:MAG TPA: isoprenylcysteine carboxylmethyltransferase family protein [Anaerolineae bacterium]|nr:isoprenylcysteine carboxylmethyltransferase family protein [Anaerolineae bacterium]